MRQPVRMMYRDLDGKIHERVMDIPFDAACTIARDYSKRGMTEIMVWRPLGKKKVGGDVREKESQVEIRESKNRFGEYQSTSQPIGLPIEYQRYYKHVPTIKIKQVMRTMNALEKDLKTKGKPQAHLCPICDHPMDAEEIESPNVNPGGSTKVWHCNNPGCYDSLREQHHTFDDPDPEIANPYLLRYDSVKQPEGGGGFARVHIGSCSAPETGRLHFCPFCDNEVEVLDSVYWIWNCPNCLLIRSGGLIERYYPIEEDGTIDTDKEIREQRRGLPRWAPFAPLKDDDGEGEE